MCGIAGLYSYETRIDRGELHKRGSDMTDAVSSRGPDDRGVWQDPDLPLILGHRRLSILDLSPLGAQPMESSSSRYIIVFNGEIYNFKTIRDELQSVCDISFKGDSDTEVILAAVEHWGFEKALTKLNGMFAFALWDRKAKALHFARDRFGKKPLYIGWAGSAMVFGSELKSICAHPDFNRNIDRDALVSYLRFGYVPAPFSIFDQIWQLLPGSTLSIDFEFLKAGQDLSPLMSYYWRPKDALEEARKNKIEPSANIVDEFEGVLSSCVEDRMISDVPLGAFLSGGVDSSTITALMQKQSSSPVKTYTIGFEDKGYNEAEHAKEIATHLGTDHSEIYLKSSDVRDLIPNIPTMFDEPFADASALPTYLVSKFARGSVTVALSGDGGDEMLGGYNRHITGPKAWDMVHNHIPAPLRVPLSNIISAVPPHIWDKIRRRPQFGHHMHKFSKLMLKNHEGDAYLSLVSTFDKPKNVLLGGHEEIIPLVDPDLQIEGLEFSEEMMYWDTLSYLSGDILTKVDRASMACSLEARAPLLDQRIFDYVWRLPLSEKIEGGTGKQLLRKVLERHVPAEMFDRPKQGFSVPIAEWLRGDLKEWAEELLDVEFLKRQGLFNYLEVRSLWRVHQSCRGANAQKIWTILMFQAWYKKWVSDR